MRTGIDSIDKMAYRYFGVTRWKLTAESTVWKMIRAFQPQNPKNSACLLKLFLDYQVKNQDPYICTIRKLEVSTKANQSQ